MDFPGGRGADGRVGFHDDPRCGRAAAKPARAPAHPRRAALEAGLEQLWEDCFLSGGVSAAAAALAWTENVRVGIGIMPVPFRNIALAAMEVATLRRMFGDRALPGIGHGVQNWTGQVGARAASPLTLLREYATALRSLLCGRPRSPPGGVAGAVRRGFDNLGADHLPS